MQLIDVRFHQPQMSAIFEVGSSGTGQCLDNFEKIRVLGRGAFGLCYLCKDKLSRVNRKVVLKMISLECRTETERKAIFRKYSWKIFKLENC